MIELFYFSGSDLLIKVEYAKEGNFLRYASHREMERGERVIAEQYIMVEVAPKTDYFIKHPSMFAYLGIDKQLEKRLSAFHHNNDMKALARDEKEINETVNSLIAESMRDYYTGKIGELLMSMRSEMKGGWKYDTQFLDWKQQMSELLNAYNIYTDQKVTLDEVIPSELRPYWPGLEEARCNAAPSE